MDESEAMSEGGLGIRSGVSQADVAFAVTVRKTETQVEMTRGGRNTQEPASAELTTMDGVTMKDDGEVRLENLDERDVLQVRFRDDIITGLMSRILETAALLSNCGAGVSTTWTEPQLRLRSDSGGVCACGLMRDERGDHTLS